MTAQQHDDGSVELDARGLRCPEPVLRLRAALARLAPGARVHLRADDPLAGVDVKAYCLRSGHALVAERVGERETGFVVEKRSAGHDHAG
jgi:tRNA 2-thiouridine synthesizing protein A